MVDILVIVGGLVILAVLIWAFCAWAGQFWQDVDRGNILGAVIDDEIMDDIGDAAGAVVAAIGEAVGDLFDNSGGDF